MLPGFACRRRRPFSRCPPSTPTAFHRFPTPANLRGGEKPEVQDLECGYFPRKVALSVPVPDRGNAPLPRSSLCPCICRRALGYCPLWAKQTLPPWLDGEICFNEEHVIGRAWASPSRRRLRDPWSGASPGDIRGTPKRPEKELFSYANEFYFSLGQARILWQ